MASSNRRVSVRKGPKRCNSHKPDMMEKVVKEFRLLKNSSVTQGQLNADVQTGMGRLPHREQQLVASTNWHEYQDRCVHSEAVDE